jgi:heme/copper-type cytochrome/quinol oxidase subunit 3
MSEAAIPPDRLPFGSVDKKGVGWWGVVGLIATEAALFAYLLFGFVFTAVQNGPSWGPAHPPHLRLAGPNTVLLLLSSLAVWWGEEGIKAGRKARLLAGFGAALALGVVFIAVQLEEWREKPFVLNSNGYASHYFTITGFHLAHVAAGVLGLAATLVWGGLRYFDRDRHAPVTYVAAYWHFVDVVWLFVFSAFYLAPRFG